MSKPQTLLTKSSTVPTVSFTIDGKNYVVRFDLGTIEAVEDAMGTGFYQALAQLANPATMKLSKIVDFVVACINGSIREGDGKEQVERSVIQGGLHLGNLSDTLKKILDPVAAMGRERKAKSDAEEAGRKKVTNTADRKAGAEGNGRTSSNSEPGPDSTSQG